jgi:hypothetical protein
MSVRANMTSYRGNEEAARHAPRSEEEERTIPALPKK